VLRLLRRGARLAGASVLGCTFLASAAWPASASAADNPYAFDPARIGISFSNAEVTQFYYWLNAIDGVLFASFSDGYLVMSPDQGRTWTITLDRGCRVFASRAVPGRLWCGGDGLYQSEDAGRTWRAVEVEGLVLPAYLQLGVRWVDDDVIIYANNDFSGATRTLFRISHDAGRSSVPFSVPENVDDHYGPFRAADGNFYAVAGTPQRVHRLGPSGWVPLAELPKSMQLETSIDSRVRIEMPNGVWLFGGDEVFRSTDFGVSWKTTGTKTRAGFASLKAVPQLLMFESEQIWYMTTTMDGPGTDYVPVMWRSADAGKTWSATSPASEIGRNVWTARRNPGNASELAAVDSNAVLKSVDDGRTWSPAWINPGLALLPNKIWWFEGSPSSLLALAYVRLAGSLSAGVIVSRDGGLTFGDARYWNGGVEEHAPRAIVDLARLDDGKLYFKATATGPGGGDYCAIYESLDGGLNWTRINLLTIGAASEALFGGLVDTLWLYSLTSTARSKDGGRTWAGFVPEAAPYQNLALKRDLVASMALVQSKQAFQLLTSTDGGDTYQLTDVGGPRGREVSKGGGKLSIDPLRSDVMYLNSATASVRRSLDGGRTWHDFVPNLAGIRSLYAEPLFSNDGRTLNWPSNPDKASNMKIVYRVPAFEADRTVVEFFNSDLGHYFMTADESEAAGIDNGAAGPGWSRTGETWKVWSRPGAGALPAYRFYAAGPNSHFFTMVRAEADGLRALEIVQRAVAQASGVQFSGWQFEGEAYAASPGEEETCALPLVPLFRLYNDRAALNDSNHRFTKNPSLRQSMLSRGWKDEGVAMCVQ